MEFIELLFLSAFFVLLYMIGAFIVSVIKEDASVVDVAWGLGFIGIALLTMFANVSFVDRSYLVLALVTIWGLRLAGHIYLRNRGKKEDWRYAQWRKDWGDMFLQRSFSQIFMLQGVLMLAVAVPIIFINSAQEAGLTIYDWAGVFVWLIGFYFETLGDYQLRKFKQNPRNKGRIMTKGLWAYTRHPNYFGEVTMWWGMFLIALNLPNGIYALVGPLTITFLIIGVSGIPLLEKKYEGNKEFQEYKKRTSAFFPWIPKEDVKTTS